ncbi:MAG: hypothetical protein KDD45_03285, partial [Bdellovibrionales bacterium]|nr:hypothetical protein [Bdellovibrionales bacterium]
NQGWIVKDMKYLANEGYKLKRYFPAPVLIKIFFFIRSLFLTKKQLEELGKFMGYALLEKKPIKP